MAAPLSKLTEVLVRKPNSMTTSVSGPCSTHNGGAIVMTHSGCSGSFPEDFVLFVERPPQATRILAHLSNSADGNLARHVCALQLTDSTNLYVDT